MKALKKKWKESQESELLEANTELKQLAKKPRLYKKAMESSTISFEKIPMLSKPGRNEVQIDKLSTIYSKEKNGEKVHRFQARTVSTNTAPDIIQMLDNLKEQVLPALQKPIVQRGRNKIIHETAIEANPIVISQSVTDSEDTHDMRLRRRRNIER